MAKPQPVTVDLLHPTAVSTFKNWGYISFFGCIAVLIPLMFFAINQVKNAYAQRQQRSADTSLTTTIPLGAKTPAEQEGWFVYTNDQLGFSIQYPAGAESTIEENDQYNRLVVFGKLLEVRLRRDTDPDIGVLYGFQGATVVSKDVQLGGVTAYKAVNPIGYGDAGGQGLPFVEFAARHNGDIYRLAFYGDADVSSEEAAIMSSFRFIN